MVHRHKSRQNTHTGKIIMILNIFILNIFFPKREVWTSGPQLQNEIKQFFLETRIIYLLVDNKGKCVSNERMFDHTGSGPGGADPLTQGKKLSVGAKSCKESGANCFCSPPWLGKFSSQNSLQCCLDCYPCTLGSQEAPHLMRRIVPFNGTFNS